MDSLKLEGIKKRIADFELNADFEVRHGERAALIGRSGSGKTSLLRVIAGLDFPDEGRILLNGNDLREVSPEHRKVGFVFQDSALFPSMTVLENAVFGLKMAREPKASREKLGMEWLAKVGLRELAGVNVMRLSGGERQRLAFVRALIWRPRIVLLDEPFSALDADLRATLRKELIGLHEAWPMPMVLVTHDQADVEAVATCRMKYEERGGVRRFIREN